MDATSEFHDKGEDISRVSGLSDGIFGVALTLLVLDLQVPDAAGAPSVQVILELWPRFFSYALTFAVVGAFWIGHHRILRHIARYNRSFLSINLFFLALVALVPFPTTLIGRFGPSHVPWILYSVNISLIGLSLFWLWRYALTHRLADESTSPRVAQYLGARLLVVSAVFLLSIGLSFARPTIGPFVPLLIVPINAIVRRVYAR